MKRSSGCLVRKTVSIHRLKLVLTVLLAIWLPLHGVALDLSRYRIGAIPEQAAYAGYLRTFEVYSEDAGPEPVYSVEASPAPSGAFRIDPATGLFEYMPGQDDRKPFELTFSADGAGQHAEQTVLMMPVQTAIPEADVFTYTGPEPDVSDYTEWLEEPVFGEPIEFNDAVRASGETRKVTITGIAVVFDREITSSPAKIYGDPANLAANADIRELEIFADTVIVRDKLHFPQTKITINARELRFEDKEGEEPACIITTPFPRSGKATSAAWLRNPYNPAAGQESVYYIKAQDTQEAGEAKNGHAGGNITLRLADFNAPESANPGTRFVLTGGNGQAAGDGKKGIDAPDINTLPWYINGVQSNSVTVKYREEVYGPTGSVYPYPFSGTYVDLANEHPAPEHRLRNGALFPYYEVRVSTWKEGLWPILVDKSDHCLISRSFPWEKGLPCAEPFPADWWNRTPLWCLNGLDAIRPGTPGRGGDSGILSSTLPVEGYATLLGGAPGAMGGDADADSNNCCEGGLHGMRNYTSLGNLDRGGEGIVERIFIWSHYNKPWAGTFSGQIYTDETIECPAAEHTCPMSDHMGPYVSDQCWLSWPVNGQTFYPSMGFHGEGNETGDKFVALDPSAQSADWLSVEGVRRTIEYMRDLYVAGHVEQVQEMSAFYLETLAPFVGDTQDDWLQLREEMQVLNHRASNNLDYFGNPAGWVPMLSFEANLAAFEGEIERAIRTLYLTYWLGNKAQAAQQRAAALEAAQDQLITEIEEFIAMYQEAEAAMPGLIMQAESISLKIQEKQAELKKIEDRLLREATTNTTPPPWKQGIKIASAVLNMLPGVQPLCGAIGSGLEIITKLDSQSPWETAGAYGEIAGKTVASNLGNFSSTLGSTLEIVKSEIEANKKDKKSGAAAQPKIAATTALMIGQLIVGSTKQEVERVVNGIGPLVSAIKGSQVPDAVVNAELQRLKASNPAFPSIINEISALMREKQVFAQKLAETLQQLTLASTGITQSGLAVIAVNQNLSGSLDAIEPRAFMYLAEMKRRAQDRLLKYQYYMAKAFEYRMLRPYSGELSLNRMFDAFENLAQLVTDAGLTDTAHDDHILSLGEFELLKEVYVEELSRITAEIFDELNTNAPERSVRVAFALNAEELAQLNNEGYLRLNLKEKNLFGRSEENLRIHDLRTTALQAHAEGGGAYGGTAVMRIKYEHSGRSLLASRGKLYTFNHYQTASVTPISWKTVYDGITGTWTESQISAASRSLLKFLLENGERSTDNLLMYSRPAAWADIIITKESVTGTGVDMLLDELRIEVEYDYFEKRTDLSELEVVVEGDLMPTIVLQNGTKSVQTDINGRGDGQGDFLRVFNRGRMVRLEAPPMYGTWIFDHWADGGGRVLKTLATYPSITVDMNSNRILHAVYVNTADTTPPNPPVITTNNGQNFTTGFGQVLLRGTVDTDVAFIELNENALDHTEGDRMWQTPVTLSIGAQVLRFVAFDEALNASQEATIVVTYNPYLDSDGDGIVDADEGDEDADNDGIPNWLDEDSDNDGLRDVDEGDHGCDPYCADSDGDGLTDGYETAHGGDPLSSDDSPVLGDVNGDGFVNASDVQLIINAVLGLVKTEMQDDVNFDGLTNSVDIQLVTNAALGLNILSDVDQLAGSARTFYVSAAAVEPCSGTLQAPFATVQEALNHCLSGRGDSIMLLPGLYNGCIALKPSVKLVGNNGAPETVITGVGGAGPVVQLGAGSTLCGIAVGDAGAHAAVAAPTGISSKVTNCILYSSGTGLYLAPGANVKLHNNAFVFNTKGVESAATAKVEAVNNIFTYNATGIVLSPGPGSSGRYNNYFGNSTNVQGAQLSASDMTFDPQFMDVFGLNLRLQNTSPLCDAGDPLPQFNDLDGSRNDVGIDGGPYARHTD